MDISSVIRDLGLDNLGGDRFRGRAPQPHRSSTRAFGGHLLAQGLRAATFTLPQGRLPQSLHAYFVRPVAVEEEIGYAVTRHLDGGAFSMRRVVATQGGEVVLELQTTAGPAWEPTGERRALDHVPGPDALPPVQEQLAEHADEHEGGGPGRGRSSSAMRRRRRARRSTPSMRRPHAAVRGSGGVARSPPTRCCSAACWSI